MIGVENSGLGRHVVDRYQELLAERAAREDEFTAIARIYRPSRQGFSSGRKDDWNLHKLFNSSTQVAASNATASLYSTLVNPANRWFQAASPDPDLNEFKAVKVWLDHVSRIMLSSFGPAVSNFYASAVPWVGDAVALGTGILTSDEWPGKRQIIDTCVSLADAVLAVDAMGRVNELHTARKLTAVQAARYYGADNLPQKVREKLGRDAGSRPDQVERLTYIQAVQPNDEYTPGRLGPKGKPWLSTHVCMEMATVVKQGGMYEPNFSAPRWDVDGNEAFGRGLGYLTLAAGTKLQAMTRDNLQAGALAARPPMGTTGTRSMRRDAKIAPGAFLHGAVSHTGQQLVRPMFTFNGLPITIEQEKHAKEEVENGWHAALLSLTGRTGLGNLEVIERMEERLRLNAPFLGRMQSEGLTAVLERRFAMLFRAGQIPDPPKEMAGKPLEMKFTSVAAMAQKSQEGVAVARILEDAYKLASSNPSQADAVWDKVDIDASMDVLAEARGAPATIMRSPEEVQRRREERAKQIEQERMMAMMQQGAGAAKDAAGAMSQMAPEDVA